MINALRRGVWLFIAATLPACAPFGWRGSFDDIQADQPWAGIGERADARIHVRSDFVKQQLDLEWRGAGRKIDANEVVASARQVLRTVGQDVQPTYPAGGARGLVRYERTRTIVCIDPIVILDVPVPLQREYPGVDSIAFFKGEAAEGNKIDFRLLGGFMYGTCSPYHQDLRWFSPELDVVPRRPTDVGEGVAIITVDWGELVLTQEGDRWIVTGREPPRCTQ